LNDIFGLELANITPDAFTRVIERLLWHLSFVEVINVDGAGDGGADIVALRQNPQTSRFERWVFQAKSKKTAAVDASAVDEVRRGMKKYNAHRGVVVTNTRFSPLAVSRKKQLSDGAGLRIDLWGRRELIDLYRDPNFRARFSQPELRRYQVDAFQACWHDLSTTHSALAVLATGLGKTVVAGSIIDRFLTDNPESKVLVLADKVELVEQLERALWRHLPSSVATQQIRGGSRPDELPGVAVATVQSAISYIRSGYNPDLIFVDEAHHVGNEGMFNEVLENCKDAFRFGATATPWRGDKFDIAAAFGPPSYKLGIDEGMRLGYLADVDYRLFSDNLDWEFIEKLSQNSYSIGDLNKRLFLPQRDEKIRDELLEVWINALKPRGIVFCATVEHADRLVRLLKRVPAWSNAAVVHSRIPAYERKTNLARFRLGDIPLLIAVDVLNEGVDVPDVNIVCFARVTHSRRIFVQQLGRGLRLSDGKTHVTVLDFVSDLRRIKAVLDLKSSVCGSEEDVLLPSSHSISFEDYRAESIFAEWLRDAADLDTAADEVRLNFPQVNS